MVELINCVPPENPNDYHDVFVYLEIRNEHITKGSLEMLGKGRELAEKLGDKKGWSGTNDLYSILKLPLTNEHFTLNFLCLSYM